jgi:anti-anti-sigma factor
MSTILIDRPVYLPASVSQTGLEFNVEDLGHVVVVRMRGAATFDQAAELEEQLRSSLGPGTRFIILDLAKLTLLDPSALAVLAEFCRDQSRKGGEVWLTGLQPAVWLALREAKLDRLFTIRASLAEVLPS